MNSMDWTLAIFVWPNADMIESTCKVKEKTMKTSEFIKKLEVLDLTEVEKDDNQLQVIRHGEEAASISLTESSDFRICGKMPRRLLNLIVDYAVTGIEERK